MKIRNAEQRSLNDLRAKRDAILALAEEYGARNVRVFGSIVRDEATAASDVDLLVDWDYARIPGWGGVGFEQALEELLHCQVNVVSKKWLHPRLRDHIMKEVIPL